MTSPCFAVLTALWKRRQVSSLVLRHTAALAGAVAAERGGKAVLVAVGSEPTGSDEEAWEREMGWEDVYAPNSPLGTKWNAGMQSLRGRADAVMCIGSDDLVSRGVVEAAWDHVVSGRVQMWGV